MSRARLIAAILLLGALGGGAWLAFGPSCISCNGTSEGETPDPALALIDPSQISWTPALTLTASRDNDGNVVLSGTGALGRATLWQNAKPVLSVAAAADGTFALTATPEETEGGVEYFVTATAADGRLVRSSDAVFLLAPDVLVVAGPARIARLDATLAASSVVIDAADWDRTPALRIAGRAPPAARVRLYLGNRMVGEATARADGQFHLRLIDMSPYGRYALRADVLGLEGNVVARAEVTFDRAPPRTMGSGTRVLAGVPEGAESGVIRLLRHEPGTGLRETLLFPRDGQTRDPAEIRPGQLDAEPLL